MIELRSVADGVLLPVRARAGGRRNEVAGEQEGRLKVSVTQAAEKGKANESITALLAKALGLRKSQVQLATGATSAVKQFLIRDVELDELRKRLAELVK